MIMKFHEVMNGDSEKLPNRAFLFILGFAFLFFTSQKFALGTTETQIPDRAINQAVERALTVDNSIPAHLIDVQTQEGIVTLAGSVPHLQAKNRSVLLVETVKGVKSIINTLTVQTPSRSNEELLQDIQKTLANDPATDSYDIQTKVEKGTVTLTGTVPSWAARALSESVVSGVRGITAVNNNLLVHFQHNRSDQDILEEIKERLEDNVWINDKTIIFTVENGVVKLNGVVGSAAEKRRVVHAAAIAGVRKIDDQLLFVKSWAQGTSVRRYEVGDRSDESIQDSLKLAYQYDPRVSVFNFEVEVTNGIVTLTGTVNNLKAKKAAEETAKLTRGVLWVKNFLKVRPKITVEDNQLRRRVELTLHDDSFINPFHIKVDVVTGRVILHGSVDSQFLKNHVEDVVSRVKGVVDVKNNLIIDKSWSWKPDKVIEEDIKEELWWTPFVKHEQVTVSVENGVATLSGTVDNYLELKMAIENAREGGAREVNSLLTIRK